MLTGGPPPGGPPGTPGLGIWGIEGKPDGGGARGLLCRSQQQYWLIKALLPRRNTLVSHRLTNLLLRLIQVDPLLLLLVPHNLSDMNVISFSIACSQKSTNTNLSSCSRNLQTVYHQLASEPRSSLSTASFWSSHRLGSAAKEWKLLRWQVNCRRLTLVCECKPSSGSLSSLSSAPPCGAVQGLKEAEEKSAWWSSCFFPFHRSEWTTRTWCVSADLVSGDQKNSQYWCCMKGFKRAIKSNSLQASQNKEMFLDLHQRRTIVELYWNLKHFKLNFCSAGKTGFRILSQFETVLWFTEVINKRNNTL